MRTDSVLTTDSVSPADSAPSSVPGLPLAQPRSVIAGHLLCVGVGYAVAAALGSAPWAAALAAGVGLAVMTVARTPHSPACATSVVIVLHSPHPASFVPLLVGSTVLLVLAGWAFSYAVLAPRAIPRTGGEAPAGPAAPPQAAARAPAGRRRSSGAARDGRVHAPSGG
ncbi:HPP family protein [Streptomyces sp. NPDC087300]|uniref:HPP family protein n=1 Tax=Streptomyces sp. NPDC087300 TaxID=3365780 RepID=UPI003823EAC3